MLCWSNQTLTQWCASQPLTAARAGSNTTRWCLSFLRRTTTCNHRIRIHILRYNDKDVGFGKWRALVRGDGSSNRPSQIAQKNTGQPASATKRTRRRRIFIINGSLEMSTRTRIISQARAAMQRLTYCTSACWRLKWTVYMRRRLVDIVAATSARSRSAADDHNNQSPSSVVNEVTVMQQRSTEQHLAVDSRRRLTNFKFISVSRLETVRLTTVRPKC